MIVATKPTRMLLPNATHTSGCSQTVSQFSIVNPFQVMLVRVVSLNENRNV